MSGREGASSQNNRSDNAAWGQETHRTAACVPVDAQTTVSLIACFVSLERYMFVVGDNEGTGQECEEALSGWTWDLA
jgi:hypothetical protein